MTTTPKQVPAAPRPEHLWDVSEVAAFLGMSAKWVYKHAALGTLPCVRMGPTVRFRPETIRAFLADHEHAPRGRQPRLVPPIA